LRYSACPYAAKLLSYFQILGNKTSLRYSACPYAAKLLSYFQILGNKTSLRYSACPYAAKLLSYFQILGNKSKPVRLSVLTYLRNGHPVLAQISANPWRKPCGYGLRSPALLGFISKEFENRTAV
jgi:hypothetical protein